MKRVARAGKHNSSYAPERIYEWLQFWAKLADKYHAFTPIGLTTRGNNDTLTPYSGVYTPFVSPCFYMKIFWWVMSRDTYHPCFPQHLLWIEFLLQMVLPWPASPRAQKHSLHMYWSRLICSLHALALACCKAPNLSLFSEPKNGKPKTDPLVAFIRDTYSPSGRGAAPLPISGFFL